MNNEGATLASLLVGVLNAFGILILILLYRPAGLFGSRLQIEAGR